MPNRTFATLLLAFLAAFMPAKADHFAEAGQAFVDQLNSLTGIELVGGPYSITEQYIFDADYGYYVLGPSERLPGLDQRLSFQIRSLNLKTRALPALPLVFEHPLQTDFAPAELREIRRTLAGLGLSSVRDEITLLDDGSVHIRPVELLPILKLTRPAPDTIIALTSYDAWFGGPLYRAAFSRGNSFPVESVCEGFAKYQTPEIPLRSLPVCSPQTFFAEPGIKADEWTKLLRTFSTLNLKSCQILGAACTERMVYLQADERGSILPNRWIKLKRAEPKENSWKVDSAIEYRADFQRPGIWWSFLPLLAPTDFLDRWAFSSTDVTQEERLALGPIVQRLRGVGQIANFSAVTDSSTRTIRIQTTHAGRGEYNLDFANLKGTWRLVAVSESTQ